jgi:tight adherence protein B
VRSLTGWRERRRRRRAGRQLHLVLGELAAHLRAGRALSQAIADVASDMPDPIRTALAGVAHSVALGTSPGVALSGLGLGEDATLLAAAIMVQSRTGGDLAMLLDDLADVLVEREGQRRMADAITAQARATARMVAGMPAAAVLFLWLIDRDAVWLLLSSPIGWGALIMSGALTLAGFLVIRRMARVAA